MEKRAEEFLERIAVAVEKLGEEPQLEIPTSPPVCPHCAQFDPIVKGHESEGTGPMSQIYLELQCTHCGYSFFVVPQGWANFTTLVELREFMGRAENDANGRETD